jgi:hypothetical protein
MTRKEKQASPRYTAEIIVEGYSKPFVQSYIFPGGDAAADACALSDAKTWVADRLETFGEGVDRWQIEHYLNSDPALGGHRICGGS